MTDVGLRPARHHIVSNQELFVAYGDAMRRLGHPPLGHRGLDELSNLTSISGSTFKKRFGGLKNFLFEYKNWLLNNKKIDFKDRISVNEDVTIKIAPKHTNNVNEKKKSEKVETNEENVPNQNRYSGRAAESLVVAELLFRNFNAEILPVDEGIDIFATNIRKNDLYLIQVKYSYFGEDNKSRSILITTSSFESNKKSNVYYIFVLERGGKKRNFLILPFAMIDHIIKGFGSAKIDTKKINLLVTFTGDDEILVNSLDMSRYLDAWDVLL